MRIWLINQYNTLPEHGHFNRNFYLAKGLLALGHEPVVLSGSSPHNSLVQLIKGEETFIVNSEYGFPYIYVKIHVYGDSRKKQILEMFRFNHNVRKTAKTLPRPDVIVGSSPHPLAALLAIRLARKYNCKSIVEIRDLWPETIVAYGLLKGNHPIIKIMYAFEKYLYKKADAIVFTMPGGRDYIQEKGWDRESGGPVSIEKIFHINNGVGLEMFDRNVVNYPVKDADLSDKSHFNLVYTGSIRLANNLDLVLETAKLLRNTKARFLVWGTGSEKERLEQRCKDEKINNVLFKGHVNKNQIPSILTQADATFFVLHDSPLYRFGLSLNKSFEYFAAGKPTLIIGGAKYSLIDQYACGLHVKETTPQGFEKAVLTLLNLDQDSYEKMSLNAKICAQDYDFGVLAHKLSDLVEKLYE